MKNRKKKAPMRQNNVRRLPRRRQSTLSRRNRTMNRLLLIALLSGSVGLSGTVGLADSAQAAGDAVAGKAAVNSCNMCHGANGEGTKMGPKIAGMSEAAFIQAMNDYKSGRRESPMMKSQTSQLTVTDIANMAAYYATQK
jgi:cytochrome c553